jgi:phosphate:Na+ symporter
MHYNLFDFLTLLGAVGLFLYGMMSMSDALMHVAGERMRSFLAHATSNRFMAVITGFTITAVIQSSSATTLMVVSFANASLLSLTESIGVIMGANIGTTVTAWLISLLGFKVKMSAIALPLVAIGFILSLSKKKPIKRWGKFIIGFSLLFIGLQYIRDSVPDIESHPETLSFLSQYTDQGMLSVLLFLIIGTVITLITQSSSVTIALTIVLCYQGWIPFDMAAAMVLGENIGTTITANLGAMVANYQAKRTAIAHLVFNLIGVSWVLLLFYGFLGGIDLLTKGIENSSPFTDRTAIPVALSLFHSTFNITNTLLLIGFVSLIRRIAERIIPEPPLKEEKIEQPHFLDEPSLEYPQTAIKALHDESLRLFETTTFKVLSHGLNVHREEVESDEDLKAILRETDHIKIKIDKVYYRNMKNIYSHIVEYATKLQEKFELDEDEIRSIHIILCADRKMVELVKNMQQLRKNLKHYIHSDNDYIREEYNKLRRMILKILRVVRKTRTGISWEEFSDKYLTMFTNIEQSDVLLNGTIDRLVREQLISNEMATSLMNDSTIAIHIARELADTSSLLYWQRECCADELHETE